MKSVDICTWRYFPVPPHHIPGCLSGCVKFLAHNDLDTAAFAAAGLNVYAKPHMAINIHASAAGPGLTLEALSIMRGSPSSLPVESRELTPSGSKLNGPMLEIVLYIILELCCWARDDRFTALLQDARFVPLHGLGFGNHTSQRLVQSGVNVGPVSQGFGQPAHLRPAIGTHDGMGPPFFLQQ